MKYISVLLVVLTGCSSAPEQLPVVITNNEKDIYITKVEQIVSESASVLTAVAPSVPVGIPRELIEGQITRLSGVSKPTVERVKEFQRVIKEQDSKAVKKDKEEAAKVEADTDGIWRLVEQKDTELNEAKVRLKLAEEERQRVIKDKILWLCSCIGGAILTAGVLILAFTTRKISGVVMIACGGLAIGSAWIFDSPWFPWIAGTGVAVAVLDFLVIAGVKTYRYLRPSRTPLEQHQ